MLDADSKLRSLNELIRLGDLLTPMAVRTASSLGIADHFDEGSTTAEILAQRLSVKVEPLMRLLSALTEVGVLSQGESGGFSLTDIGRVLRKDYPFSMRDAFTIATPDIRAWAQLEHCVRTGQSGFEHAYGETHRSYRSRNMEEDIRMDRAHQAATRLDLLTLARAYPWSEAQTVIDVGGGTGTFLAGILRRFPRLQGILFDLPRMIANAAEVIEEHGVAERCRVIAGDFFYEVPAGGDVYVLKAVAGGWDDSSCVRLLATVRRAMRLESRLLLIEPVAGVEQKFSRGNIVQLHSLVLYGGIYRSVADYRRLADSAGLAIYRVIPRSTLPIIELTPMQQPK
jgi:hypothetical protein